MAQLRRGRRDNVISYIVHYSFHLWGKKKRGSASSDLSARRGENPALGPEKLNSP